MSETGIDSAATKLPTSEVIYDAGQISSALDKLAATLNKTMVDTNPVILCVMNGALIFSGHLLTRFTFPCELDYVHATRYRNTTEGKNLKWLAYPNCSLKDRAVLILDDILDEGVTLKAIEKYCYSEGASNVETAVLLHKKHNRCCFDIRRENVALEVEDNYVFGFGMDYEGQFRHLNAIYSIKGLEK